MSSESIKDDKKEILLEVDDERQDLHVAWLYAYLWARDYVVELVDEAYHISSESIKDEISIKDKIL